MTREDFHRQMKAGEIAACYLFEGEEEYTKEAALRTLRGHVLKGEFASLNESVLLNPSEDELIARAETLPFLADRRLILVRESAWLAASRSAKGEEADDEPESSAGTKADRVSDYVAKLPDTACLVFFVRGKANGTRKLYKRIAKLGGVFSFDPLDQPTMLRWINQVLKGYGKQMARQTAEQLLFAVGRDMHVLANELAKLAASAGDREEITREDIDAVCIKTTEYKVFDLSDAVVLGNSRRSLQLLNDMLKEGEQRLLLLALLQRQYRQLLFAKILQQSRASTDAIARELKVPSFVARKLSDAAADYSLEQLEQACGLLVDTEYLVKSGQMPEEGALEQAVLKLLAARKEPAHA